MVKISPTYHVTKRGFVKKNPPKASHSISINRNNEVFVDNVLIKDSIFEEEKFGFKVRERTEEIEKLKGYIEDAQRSYDRRSDLYLMENDLKYLKKLHDQYVFSSISTNEFVAKSDDLVYFNDLCEQLLQLNARL